MGLIPQVIGGLFGNGVNVVRDTAEVFRVNAEKADAREADLREGALEQFATEFRQENRSGFDRLIDGMNRLPRPMLAFGTLGLIASAMISPEWFGARMFGLQLVPEPLWWLMGAIVSFYFGARYQAQGQDFQRAIVRTIATAPTLGAARALEPPAGPESPQIAAALPDASLTLADPKGDNPALADWKSGA